MPRKTLVLHLENVTPLVDITNQNFDRLTVISFAGRTDSWHEKWNCICVCGKSTIVSRYSLVNGNTRSCGCLQREFAKSLRISHRMSKTNEYKIWCGIIKRCLNPKCKAYKHYGKRGITICDRWHNSFENFYADMGKRPSKLHSIERKNNNGNYEPDNCIWATEHTQSRNRRNNVVLTLNGVSHVMTDWCAITGISRGTLRDRLKYGWSVEETLTTPPLKHRYERKKPI